MKNTNNARILERELSYRLQGVFISVSRQYGHLYKESIYHKATQEQFDLENFVYISNPKIDIFSLVTGKKLGVYVPDFIIENKIVVELKALPFLSKDAIEQLSQYLKASIYEVGYLVNYGEYRARIIRRIYTNDRKPHIRALFVTHS